MAERKLAVKVFNDADEGVINKWLSEADDIGEVVDVSLAGVGGGQDLVGWRYVILYRRVQRSQGSLSMPSSQSVTTL